MKNILILLCFTITSISFSQKKEIKSFKFNNVDITYTRVDYSKYEISQFFITMYNASPETKDIEKQSINCLNNQERLYHTLYFFVELPRSIKDENQRNDIFTKFIEHLKQEENQTKIDLYLNFDLKYSIPYQTAIGNVKRIITNITSEKICKTLTIN